MRSFDLIIADAINTLDEVNICLGTLDDVDTCPGDLDADYDSLIALPPYLSFYEKQRARANKTAQKAEVDPYAQRDRSLQSLIDFFIDASERNA